jgi:hypothetical protein
VNWTCEQIPAAPSRESILHTTAAADGVAWAFGISPNPQGWFDTLAFRRDTHGWRPVTIPGIGRANRAIAIGADDVWVVGDNNTSLHYNGARWQQTPTAALGRVQAQLFGLAQFGGHDVWAAGYAPDRDRGRGTVQHYDGHAWTDQPLPSVATNWGLSGIGGTRDRRPVGGRDRDATPRPGDHPALRRPHLAARPRTHPTAHRGAPE